MARTRIAGPDIPFITTRVTPLATEKGILILGVILHEGVPTTVLDLADSFEKVIVFGEAEQGVYWPCIYQAISHERGDRVRLECGCRAGRICKRHGPEFAERYWRECEAKQQEQTWCAALEGGGWVKYPDENPPKRITEEAAVRDAIERRLPTVSCRNGHGKLLWWKLVAKEQS